LSYARGTAVPTVNSQLEISRIVAKYGGTHYGFQTAPERFTVGFVSHGRVVRFQVPAPQQRSKDRQSAEERRLWRCLVLVIKAKLEIVASGIETFDQAFLANIVTDGRTIWEHLSDPKAGIKLLVPSKDPP